MSEPAHWRAAAPQALAWRRFDDEVVIYNDATGSTHQLGALAGEIMLSLIQNPSGMDLYALVRDLTARVELAGDLDVATEVQRALDGLSELHLAARAPA
jgi:PqqD family protein of HPr-rel-A system